MTANAMISFDFEAQPVRTVERNGVPWFVLADVCRVLGLANPRDVAAKLDDDERATVGLTDGRLRHDMNIVSEGGLYTIILRSRKAVEPGSVPWRFRRWLTHEVLPALRKNGFYGNNGQPSIAEQIALNKEIERLLNALTANRHAAQRQVLHAMLAQACNMRGISPPALDQLGHDAPEAPDILADFWQAIGVLRAAGVTFNHSRAPGLLALNLPQLKRLFAEAKICLRVDRELKAALRLSESPRYLGTKTVNSVERKAVSCWVFELVN